jgi:superfamily I DNA/RNA helicase
VTATPPWSPELAVAWSARTWKAAGVSFGYAARRGLEEPVTLVPIDLVKGLEMDAVVVVEPARIVSEQTQGLRALYVALTRSTKRLSVVHAQPLPEALVD